MFLFGLMKLIFWSAFSKIMLGRHKLLSLLLTLEFLMINLIFLLNYFSFKSLTDYLFFILFLVISVCEAVVSLSMMVYLIRNSSSGSISSSNLSMC